MHARLSHVTHVALHRRHLRMTCPRCRQSRILHGVAVWWLFERKSWDDAMGKVAVHFYCAACQKRGNRVRPRVEITADDPNASTLPLPDDRTWKRLQSRYRS